MVKILLKLFFYTGIPFGFLMTICFIVILGFEFSSGIQFGLLSGAAFGIIMTLLLGYLHLMSVKKTGLADSKNAYDVKHSANMNVSLRYEDAFQLCLKSLEKVKTPAVQHQDSDQGMITAKTGKTWNTWGDIVSFQLRKVDEHVTSIEVESRPAKFQIIDYGENLKNIHLIQTYLKEHA